MCNTIYYSKYGRFYSNLAPNTSGSNIGFIQLNCCCCHCCGWCCCGCRFHCENGDEDDNDDGNSTGTIKTKSNSQQESTTNITSRTMVSNEWSTPLSSTESQYNVFAVLTEKKLYLWSTFSLCRTQHERLPWLLLPPLLLPIHMYAEIHK